MTNINPQEIYDRLIAESLHPAKRKGLEIIHAICRERFDSKATSWSVASIGRISTERGGPTAASLRQPSLEQYRALIAAWAAYSAESHPHEKAGRRGSDDWISSIDNLAVRQLTYILRSDLERTRAEVRRLQKLRMDGGILSSPLQGKSNAPSYADPSPNQVRELARFVQHFIDNDKLLLEKGIVRKSGSLWDSDTGEAIIDVAAIQLLRRIVEN